MVLQIDTYIDMYHYMYIYICTCIHGCLFLLMAVDVALSFEILDLRLQGVALRALEICQRDLASLDHIDRTQIRVHLFARSRMNQHIQTPQPQILKTQTTKTI